MGATWYIINFDTAVLKALYFKT